MASAAICAASDVQPIAVSMDAAPHAYFLANPDAFPSALCEALRLKGALDDVGIDRAIRAAQQSGDSFPSVLLSLGLVGENDLAGSMATLLALDESKAGDFPSEPVFADRLSPRFLREMEIISLAVESDCVILAMTDPLNAYAMRAVGAATGLSVRATVCGATALRSALDRLYPGTRGHGSDSFAGDDASLHVDIERLKDMASEAPVIRYVGGLIADAIDRRASDIHIESYDNRLRVRLRIDGRLQDVAAPAIGLRAAILSRIKIMASLNIAERRLPQDGQIKLPIRGKPVDLRVAIAPGMHGETAVIRILNRSDTELRLEALGLAGKQLQQFRAILERPHGMLLVAGPTGSGKSTTLYASLLTINRQDRKIITVEDPVEYQIEGINQIQVKPGIGLTFAHVLRSVLRHDPDVIMIGEIRDRETAEIAARSALTGHLVLSTIHTNSAAASIARLLDMGVEEYLIAATVNGIVAQRLVRTLCPDCRRPNPLSAEIIRRIADDGISVPADAQLYEPIGCPACDGTGYRGRTAIFEILTIDDAVRSLVLRRADTAELVRMAVEQGMTTMHADGLGRAFSGQTTVEEVLGVTGEG